MENNSNNIKITAGSTYISAAMGRDIIKIISIKNGEAVIRNISQNCTIRKEVKNIFVEKELIRREPKSYKGRDARYFSI